MSRLPAKAPFVSRRVILSTAVEAAPKVPATEVRASWADLVGRVQGGERLVVMNWGRPIAAIVPITDLDALHALETRALTEGALTEGALTEALVRKEA